MSTHLPENTPESEALITAICKRYHVAVTWSNIHECYVVVQEELGMLSQGMGLTKFGALVDALKENGTNVTIVKRYMRKNSLITATLSQAMEAFNKECAPVTENNVVRIPVVYKPFITQYQDK